MVGSLIDLYPHPIRCGLKPDYNRYKKEQSWYEKVKSKRTGEYNQAEDLIKRELVPENWTPPDKDKEGKPLKSPIEICERNHKKEVN